MYQVNPMQLIQMIKSGQNPQQLLMSIMKDRVKGTPMGDNLLSLMESNILVFTLGSNPGSMRAACKSSKIFPPNSR